MDAERRRWWFWLHSWVGLKLSLLLGFVLLTGTCAVLSYEIDWLLNEPMRASAAVAPDDIAWGAALDATRAERPDWAIMSLERIRGEAFSLHATVFTPWREPRRLWLDPVDGAWRGETRWFNVQRFFRMTHRHLMLPPKVGVPIVAALALPLAVSLVSGLIVYRRFWRGLFKKPRTGRGARMVLGDVHRLAGVWGTWFVALMVVTGCWYLVESLGGRAPELPAGDPPAPRDVALPADFDGRRLDAAVAAAREAFPGLEVSYIGFPTKPGEPIAIGGQASAMLVRPRANRVYVDPSDGAVLGQHRGEDLGVHLRISEAANPLHFGTFGGLGTQLLWFVMGIGLTGLAFTGSAIYATRLRRASQREERRSADWAEASRPGETG